MAQTHNISKVILTQISARPGTKRLGICFMRTMSRRTSRELPRKLCDHEPHELILTAALSTPCPGDQRKIRPTTGAAQQH